MAHSLRLHRVSFFGPVVLAILLTGQSHAGPPLFRMEDWATEYLDTDPRGHRYLYPTGATGDIVDGEKVLSGFGFRASANCIVSPLQLAYGHGYSFSFPWLHEDDLVPVCGRLYRIGAINTGKVMGRRAGAVRLPEDEMPEGVRVGAESYVFPLEDSPISIPRNGNYHSGTLHKRFIYVWEIAATEGEPHSLRAKVGTLDHTDKYPMSRDKDIVWKWVRVGDFLEVGEHRHKVLAIVPPIEPPQLNRDDARMAGWVELDPVPVEEKKDNGEEEKAEEEKPHGTEN